MLYIITHKECEIPNIEGYVPLLVGAAGKACDTYLRDDCGENISEKNPDYCELTGLYWIWKNTDDEYAGIVHYRRYFSKGRLKAAIYPIEQLNDILQTNDVIISYTEHIRFSLKRKMLISHCSEEVFSAMRDSVKEIYPDYLETFDCVFQGNTMSICNMIYCKKKLLNDYCRWLFDILEATEKKINDREISYQPRLYGYLGERLMNVWIEHLNIKCKKVPVVNIEHSIFKKVQRNTITYVSEGLFQIKCFLHIKR